MGDWRLRPQEASRGKSALLLPDVRVASFKMNGKSGYHLWCHITRIPATHDKHRGTYGAARPLNEPPKTKDEELGGGRKKKARRSTCGKLINEQVRGTTA